MTPLIIIASVLKHWRLILAFVALGACGVEGFHLAKSWDRERALVEQAAVLKQRLETVNAINEAYTTRYKSDQEDINKLKDEARETPVNGNGCLPLDAARRVRVIGQPKRR